MYVTKLQRLAFGKKHPLANLTFLLSELYLSVVCIIDVLPVHVFCV